MIAMGLLGIVTHVVAICVIIVNSRIENTSLV